MSDYTDCCGSFFADTGNFFYLLTAINACRLEAEQADRLPVFPAWLTAALTEAFCSFSDSLTQGNIKETLDKAFCITAKQKQTYASNGNLGFMALLPREFVFRTADNIRNLFGINKETSLNLAVKINNFIMNKHSEFVLNFETRSITNQNLLQEYNRIRRKIDPNTEEDLLKRRQDFLSIFPEPLQKEIKRAAKYKTRKPRRNPSQ